MNNNKDNIELYQLNFYSIDFYIIFVSLNKIININPQTKQKTWEKQKRPQKTKR